MEHQPQTSLLDILIIGAGPTGLSCGIEAKKCNLNYVILEKGSLVNTIRRYPTNMTFFSTPELLTLGDVPFPTTGVRPNRQEALQYYRGVAEYFGLDIRQYSGVESIEKQGDEFRVRSTGKQKDWRTKRVVIATGYFDNTNRLAIQGEDLPHVSHYYDEPYAYSGMKVVVIGGRNSAVEATLELYRHGSDVTLVHRKDDLGSGVKYWVRPDMVNRIKNSQITAHFNSVVTEIRPHELDIQHVNTGETQTLTADFVFPLIGYRPDEELLRNAGVELDEKLIPNYHSDTFETNVEGLYIAGSVACGCETWTIFIENGRAHAKPILEHVAEGLSKK